jgi:hypothetical protein
MLRPRDPEPGSAARPDPLVSLTVAALSGIAFALLAAAVLAVYTYSTPDVELPLVIAITLAFSTVLILNLLRLIVRRMRLQRR